MCLFGDVCAFVTVPAIFMCLCGDVCLFVTVPAIRMSLSGHVCPFVTVHVIGYACVYVVTSVFLLLSLP